jgi:hypothetical protein
MKIRRSKYLMLFLLLLIPFVSANGLIVSPTTASVNKTIGSSSYITFNITNSEPLDFLNVTSENRSILDFGVIGTLTSGSTITVSANVSYDTTGTFPVKIVGYYNAPIGHSNVTHTVTIADYTFLIDNCDLSIVKGDSIVWKNNNVNVIKLREGVPNTGIVMDGGTLSYNSTLLKTYPVAREFTYYVALDSFPPTSQLCHVIVNNDSGMIHDRNLDATFNIDLKVTYPPTTLIATFLQTNYSMDFLDQTDGVMSIKNNGTNDAKHIHLSGDWFSFSKNDFDLPAGNTQALYYTINPIITSTEDTNKSYDKHITIASNSNTVDQVVTVFINYANIGEALNNSEDINTLLAAFCAKYPSSRFCSNEPAVVYKYVSNGSDAEFNVTMTQEQFKDMWVHIINSDNARTTLENYIKEKQGENSGNWNVTSDQMQQLAQMFESYKINQEESLKGIIIFTISMIVFICCFVVGVLIYFYRKRKKAEELRRY